MTRQPAAAQCQIHVVSLRRRCRRKVAVRRWTGSAWIALCAKDDNPAIGPLETQERAARVVELTDTERCPSRPQERHVWHTAAGRITKCRDCGVLRVLRLNHHGRSVQ